MLGLSGDQRLYFFSKMMTTHPGSYTLFPAAFRLCSHNFFMANPPSWAASEEPVVAVPIAPLADGACQRLARIETQRVWIFSDLGITRQQEKWKPDNLDIRVAGYSSESCKKHL